MNVHEQFADDLSLYALGALDGAERLAVEHSCDFAAAHTAVNLSSCEEIWP